MVLDDEVFLASETAPHVGADDLDLLRWDAEDADDPLVVVVDALGPGVDRERPVLPGDGQGALDLHEGVLGLGRPELLSDDDGRLGDRLVRVAPLERVLREEVPLRVEPRGVLVERPLRVDERREDVVVEVDLRRGLLRLLAGLGGHEGDGVADVARLLADGDHRGPVVDDVAVEAVARYVGGRQDGLDARHRERLGGVDSLQEDPRFRGPEHRAVEHPGDLHVVDVDRRAEDLLPRVDALDPRADAERGLVAVRYRGPLLEDPRRVDDRLLDLHVAGAAAEVRGEPLRQVVVRRFRVGVDDPLGADHHAGHAEPALHRPGVGKGVGVDVLLTVRQSLDGNDLLPLELVHLLEAGTGGLAVHEDHAGAADPFRAAVLHRGDVQLLPEELEQVHVLAAADVLTVDLEARHVSPLAGAFRV